MLSTDPGDGPGRPLPRDEPPVPGGGAAGDPDRAAGTPAPPLRDIVPPAAMANGGGYQGTEFVPCFASVQRLSAWASPAGAQRAATPGRRRSPRRTSWSRPRAWPVSAAPARPAPASAAWGPDAIDAWIARSTRPFYVRA